MKFKAPIYFSKLTFWSSFLQFSTFAFFLFGVKLWIIGNYGNATPFWDQWDGEGANLYKPFLSGKLHLSDLFAPHNEHRILTTRLLALFLLKINTIWNPLLQMTVNACLHIIVLIVGISCMIKVIGRQHLPVALAFSLILFGIPYAWEATLAGFQSQFYFVLLFSIVSLWLTTTKEPLTLGWWAGTFCAVLAFLSVASGVFALGAAAFTGLVVFLSNLRRTPKQLTAVSILGILFLICIKLTPAIPGHAEFKAQSFHQFYSALMSILGWPVSPGLLGSLIRNLPALIFVVIILRKPPHQHDKRWFLFAMVLWSVGQAFTLAYGRAALAFASRYMDLFAITVLVNFACLISITQTYFRRKNYRASVIPAIWSVIILFCLSLKGLETLPLELAVKRDGSLVQEANTKHYLQTGDTNFIKHKERLEIPYPDAERLAMILAIPEIIKILPSDINPGIKPISIDKQPENSFITKGYYPTTTGSPDSAWGSYNLQGNSGTGSIAMTYDAPINATRILLPVAGYPLNNGMQLLIEQDGKKIPLIFAENPKEKWDIVKANVHSGRFSIFAKDDDQTAWLAIGQPMVAGRLDGLTYRLLNHYYSFILIGLMGIIFLMAINGFRKEKIIDILKKNSV